MKRKSRQPIVYISREEILERDGNKCHYCNHPLTLHTMHVDHIISVSRGGSSEPVNLVASCPRCNISKGERSPNEWRPDFVFEPGTDLETKVREWVEAYKSEIQRRDEEREKINAERDRAYAERETERIENERNRVEKKIQVADLRVDELIDELSLEDEVVDLSDDDFDSILAARIAMSESRLRNPNAYE